LRPRYFNTGNLHSVLTPAHISEMVRTLEERLGVRLVERTTRSVAATAAGEHLIERIRGPCLRIFLRLTAAPPAVLRAASMNPALYFPEASAALFWAECVS
jgi:DNA-binding transcriptional LysR family regulator